MVSKQLAQTWNGHHFQVHLMRDAKKFTRYVHHLVLEAFVGPRPPGMSGLHRDDDPANNHVDNLYWGTSSENAFDRVRNGNDHNARKDRCKRGHLLEGENLAPWMTGGRRCCLACNRAKSLARYRGVGDEAYVQALSDEMYQAIRGEATA